MSGRSEKKNKNYKEGVPECMAILMDVHGGLYEFVIYLGHPGYCGIWTLVMQQFACLLHLSLEHHVCGHGSYWKRYGDLC